MVAAGEPRSWKGTKLINKNITLTSSLECASFQKEKKRLNTLNAKYLKIRPTTILLYTTKCAHIYNFLLMCTVRVFVWGGGLGFETVK